MADDQKAINGVRGWVTLVVSVLVSLVGSSGGTIYWISSRTPAQIEAVARRDPATGTELALLRREVEVLRDEHNTHVGPQHPDQANLFDRRLTTLETEMRAVMRRIETIERSQ